MTTGPTFEEWSALNMRWLLRTAWLLTGDVPHAEDLVQSTLLRCWPRWSRIRRMDNVEAYVRRVLGTIYLGSQRRRWRAETPVPEMPNDLGYADPMSDDRGALLAALRRLPPGQRAVIVLRYAEDLSEAQTASHLGISVGTVKSQAARALRSLRQDSTFTSEVRHD